ncbi:MAG TPA: hypothetical protein VF092_17235 [Longimicrobium sp.]
MQIRTLAAAALVALPASTLLVACDRRGEDTSDRQKIEQRALERDLDIALRPDTPAAPAQIADVPVTAEPPAATPPAPAPEPEPAAPTRPQRQTRRPPPPPEREPEPAPVAEAPAPAAPQYVTRTAAAGQTFAVSFDRQVSARTDGVGSTFTATLTDALVDDLGRTVIPAGATVTGRITSAERGHLGLAFTSVSYAGEHYPIDASVVTNPVTRQVNLDSRGERIAKVAAPAAAGAVIGRVIGRNRRGAVVGAVIGAAAGAATAGATATVDTVVDPGATATIRLDGPVTVRRRAD